MPISSTLLVRGRDVHNVFQLLGDDEDSISLAIAWGFAKVPGFLARFLKRVAKALDDGDEVQIRIHSHEAAGGITDIELTIPGSVHVIIEAKRGWALPGRSQLKLYAN